MAQKFVLFQDIGCFHHKRTALFDFKWSSSGIAYL